jgi:molybdopterin/thiamine biosynthesis adenylyltransferase
MNKKIAFIGCGGINSWAIANTRDVLNTFFKDASIMVSLYDKDEVEEKNLLQSNQNFNVEDVLENKAEVLANRYTFISFPEFIEQDNISELKIFDIVVLGVDNNKTRALVYKYCIEHKITVLDLRAQGTQVFYTIVDGKKPFEYYKEKYFSNEDVMERKGSCQLQRDIEEQHVENGNKIIATIGIYGILLKLLRNETVENNEWRWVY